MSNYCKNCQYWFKHIVQTDIIETGKCKRYPPGIAVEHNTETFLFMSETTSHIKYQQPTTKEIDHCGEYKPKD